MFNTLCILSQAIIKGQNRTESPLAIQVYSWQATVYKQLAADYFEQLKFAIMMTHVAENGTLKQKYLHHNYSMSFGLIFTR